MDKNILIVDDERSLRECLALVFEDEGFEVRTSVNGKDALMQQQKSMADVILSDVMMPGTDGLTLLAELRRRGDRTPVVLMSAASTIAVGPNERFITKPFDLDTLISLVQGLIHKGTYGSLPGGH